MAGLKWYLDLLSPQQLEKQHCHGPPLTKLSGSLHASDIHQKQFYRNEALFYLLFSQVLESIWLVVKSNMNLVITVLTSTLSLVFGGGTALLNFVISSVS